MADDKVLVEIAKLNGRFDVLDRDLKALAQAGLLNKQAVDGLRSDMNGRFKKLEHTVFGNEESGTIGLAEKFRSLDDVRKVIVGDERENILPLPERVRNLESGWAKLTAVAVFGCSVAIEGLKWAWNSGMTLLQSRSHP